jgi:hypothetical protein
MLRDGAPLFAPPDSEIAPGRAVAGRDLTSAGDDPIAKL